MTRLDEPQSRKQRVRNAVVRLLDTDEYGNSRRYFQAGDIADSDSELTSKMVGSYLPKLVDESPLASGVSVARHTVRNSSTVWVVEKEGEDGGESE
jgi:hypothetical protein